MPTKIYEDDSLSLIAYGEGEPPFIGPAYTFPVFKLVDMGSGATHNIQRPDAVRMLSALATELEMEVRVREKVPGAVAPGEPCRRSGIEPYVDEYGNAGIRLTGTITTSQGQAWMKPTPDEVQEGLHWDVVEGSNLAIRLEKLEARLWALELWQGKVASALAVASVASFGPES